VERDEEDAEMGGLGIAAADAEATLASAGALAAVAGCDFGGDTTAAIVSSSAISSIITFFSVAVLYLAPSVTLEKISN